MATPAKRRKTHHAAQRKAEPVSDAHDQASDEPGEREEEQEEQERPQEPIFFVDTKHPLKDKRKRMNDTVSSHRLGPDLVDKSGNRIYKSTFGPHLDCRYSISFDDDKTLWYKNSPHGAFRPEGASDNIKISVGDCVSVNGANLDTSSTQEGDIECDVWYGKILEIRSVDGAHVYLRIIWLYQAQDTPSGIQDYHGSDEVFPSNHMQTINALSVDNKIELIKWEPDRQMQIANLREAAEDDGREILIYRQTLNVVGGPTLSKLDTYCTCNKPAFTDEALVGCGSCNRWMHDSCIAHEALKQYNAGTLQAHTPEPAGDTKDEPADDEGSTVNLNSPSKRPSIFGGIMSYVSPFMRDAPLADVPANSTPSKSAHGLISPNTRALKRKADDATSTPNQADGKSPKKNAQQPVDEDVSARVADSVEVEKPMIEIYHKVAQDNKARVLMKADAHCLFKDCRKVLTAQVAAEDRMNPCLINNPTLP